jgi:hypothetical protein
MEGLVEGKRRQKHDLRLEGILRFGGKVNPVTNYEKGYE